MKLARDAWKIVHENVRNAFEIRHTCMEEF